MLAGLVAGAIGAIDAAIVGWILTAWVFEAPHDYANSLTVVVVALVLGVISGALWRKLRASPNGRVVFTWAIVGAFFATLSAVVIADQTVVNHLAPYAVPLTAIIFITIAAFTPTLSASHTAKWVAAIPVLLALALGVALYV